MPKKDNYEDFVFHPRYGRGPRITGLDPVESNPKPGELVLRCRLGTSRIPNTAIEADKSKQKITTMGISH